MFKVTFLNSENNREYRSYKYMEERQVRKIAEKTAIKHNWKVLSIIKDW